MANNSHIEWTNATWNPVTGCTKISPGCKHCYAERMARRLKAMGQPNYANGFSITVHNHMLQKPFQWKKPCVIFVNSMSDLFHEDIPFLFIEHVFEVMSQAHWHQFQVLTKRSERLVELAPLITWPENVWMGVSVENQDYKYRIEHLKITPSNLKFLSIEPLLGPIPEMDLFGIDWVIVGGESGPKSRPMDRKWVVEIRDQCKSQNVPFFFKQWGGTNKKKTGRILENKTWDELPEGVDLRLIHI